MSVKQFLKNQLRNGQPFKRYMNELEQTAKYSDQEIETYQYRKLRQTIDFSYQNVPYYHKLFDSLNLKPQDIQTKEDLKKLPFLDKATVRENLNLFRNKNRTYSICKRYSPWCYQDFRPAKNNKK